MLRAANQRILESDPVLVHQAIDWDLFRMRANGSGAKRLFLNDKQSNGVLVTDGDIYEIIVAPGDNIFASGFGNIDDLGNAGWVLNYSASMIWPNEIAGGRTVASRSDLVSLTLGFSKNVIESSGDWYEVTTLSAPGSSAYRIAVNDKRGLQYVEPPAGKQWRLICGPGDYVALVGGGTVSVGITVTQIPPVDRLIKKLMEKLRGL